MKRRDKRTLVCFLGVDGSGKTTAAKELCQRLERMGLNCRYLTLGYSLFQLIPAKLRQKVGKPLLPLLGSKPAASKASPGLVTERVKKSTLILLWLTLFLRLLDSLIVYLVKIRPAAGKSVVVCDRYFYDYAIFYLDACPRWLLWCYRRLIPEPDLIFLLDVDPLIAQARDRDHPQDFYPRYRKRYLDFTRMLNPRVLNICDANNPEQEIASFICNRVLEVIKGGAEDA